MKCIEKAHVGIIKRVSNPVAEELVEKGWAYCPKWKWRQASKPAV